MELKPYAEEEAKALKVTAVPGTVLMIRSDKLRVRHLCRTRTLLLSCNLQASGGTNARLAPNPCAAKLQVWLDERLHNLKQAETEDRRAELPRHLRLAMNRQCFKGQYMAVRGLASRVAPCWGPETFWCGRGLSRELCFQCVVRLLYLYSIGFKNYRVSGCWVRVGSRTEGGCGGMEWVSWSLKFWA
ncbi:unnamed protein product [Symbiodinium sp. CCMP2456]|nr:unnamed protein product [Symbiodinium sp. CCMP2456]